MSHKKSSSLGRGLGDLLAKAVTENKLPLSTREALDQTLSNLFELPIFSLKPGRYQPRRQIHQDELEMLAASIREQGILQPILVRALGNSEYEIIAGERRYQAAKLVGLEKIPVIVKEVPDKEALAIALIENIQRENLNPLEEAIALDRLAKEFGLTHIQVAEAVGKSRATVTNLLRLLGLTEDVKTMLSRGDIELGHAKVLLTLQGKIQAEVARQIIAKNLSVRETEKLISKNRDDRPEPKRKVASIDPDVRRLQEKLSEQLGAIVEIVQGAEGKGKLVIHYHSLEELDGILAHIQ